MTRRRRKKAKKTVNWILPDVPKHFVYFAEFRIKGEKLGEKVYRSAFSLANYKSRASNIIKRIKIKESQVEEIEINTIKK